MKIKINREQPFQVLATNFSIGPSSSGYDLQISADGVNYTTLFSVGANVTRMVTGVANGSYYKLAGNTDEDVIVNWFRQCDDGQGGGGAGSQGPMGPQGPQGPSNSGYKISLSTHAYENYTEEDIAAINTFLAAVSADSATLNGAYIVVGGQDVFYLSKYEEGYALFGDVNDGFIHSISWNFDPETAKITGGEYVVNTIPEGGNEPAFGLKAVEALGTNWDNPEAGDVQAHFSAYKETQEVSGTFSDGFDTEGILPTHIICNENIDGTVFTYNGSTWSIIWGGTNINLSLVDGEDNINEYFSIIEKGDASDDGYTFSLVDGNDVEHFSIFVEKNFEINNSIDGTDTAAFANYFSIPTGITGEYTGYTEETKAIADGVWQYSPVSGAIAEWSNLPARSADDVRSFALSFDYIPDGTELFRVRYFSNNYYTKLVYSGNALYTFTEEDGYTNGTYLCSMNDSNATLPVSTGPSTHPKLKISKHNIAFYQFQSAGFGLFFWEGFWDCTATGAHWFRVDRPAPKLYLGDGTHSGLLCTNGAGLIVGWSTNQPIKRNNKINNSYVNVYAGSNVPNIWAPTDGGTEGQVLTSTGNGAPAWATLIKAVQITSDAYEALQTKDPNTLYLIVNSD